MDRQRDYTLIQLSTSSSASWSQQASNGVLDMPPDLYRAVCEGRTPEVMAMLLRQDGGSDLHKVSTGRNTVLHLAASGGHNELIKKLYASSSDTTLLFSSHNSNMDTPLHCAARAGRDDTVCLLLQLQHQRRDPCSLGCKNKAGETALHLAARLGLGAAVEAMVSQEPELASQINKAGVSPLYLAVMSRSVPAVEAIIKINRASVSAAGPSLQNALHAAVFQGLEMVNLLLKWKPSLASGVDDRDSTPLHFASSDGDRSIVCAILHTDDAVLPSMVRMQDFDGRSALHVAARMDHANIVEELMKTCPDAAELRDKNGATFLHEAARGGRSKVVALAIRKPMLCGLLNLQDNEGNTMLHLAVKAGASDVAEDLIRHHEVQAGMMNNDGHTPLDLVTKSTSFFSMLSLVVTLTTYGAQPRPQRQDQVVQWDDDDKVPNGIHKMSDGLAVVAVLFATVAFSAANNVPGTYTDGKAVLQEMLIFRCYLLLNTVALIASVMAVVLLIYGKAARSVGRSLTSFVAALHFIWVSLIAMIMAFYAALAAVTTRRKIPIVVYSCLFFLLPVLVKLAMDFIAQPLSRRTFWKSLCGCVGLLKGKHDDTRRRVSRKYMFANTYVPNLILFHFTYVVAIVGILIVTMLDQRQQTARNSHAPAPSPGPLLGG